MLNPREVDELDEEELDYMIPNQLSKLGRKIKKSKKAEKAAKMDREN